MSRGSILTVISATGTLEAVDTVQVGTQVSGAIQSLGADFNSIVKKGQVLARLDPSLIPGGHRTRASQPARRRPTVERAEREGGGRAQKYERAQALAARELIAAADLDAAELTRRTNEAQVKSAAAQVTQARAALAPGAG